MRKVREQRARSISLSAISEQKRRTSGGEIKVSPLGSPSLLRKKAPEGGDFDKQFFAFVLSMGIEGEARDRLAAMPLEQKRAFLDMHQSKQAGGVSRAQGYASQLADGVQSETLLTAVRVCVLTEPVEWLDQFAAAGGPAAVLSQMSAAERPGGEETQRQARLLLLVQIVAGMLLTKRGRQILLLEHKDVLQRVALCLDPRTVAPGTRGLLYDRLALLCNHEPQFCAAVASAMEYYAFAKREAVRHLDLLGVLRDEPDPAVRTSALRFVNVLISTPEDLDERLRTRRAFLALGLARVVQQALPALKAHEAFAVEADIFFKDMLEDERLLALLVPEAAAGGRAAELARRGGFGETAELVEALLQLLSAQRKEAAELRARLAVRAQMTALLDGQQEGRRREDEEMGGGGEEKSEEQQQSAEEAGSNPPEAPPGLPEAPEERWNAPVPAPMGPVRPIHWSRLPLTAVRSTLWDALKEGVAGSASTFDFAALEAAVRAPSGDSSGSSGSSAPAPASRPARRPSVIPDKRARLVEIFLRSTRLSAEELTTALSRFDWALLTPELTPLLQEAAPTAEEVAAVVAANVPPEEQTLVERFFLAIGALPGGPAPRVSLALARHNLSLQAGEVAEQCRLLARASRQTGVNGGQRWRAVLTALLTAGNFVNKRHRKLGDAAGVRLASLLALGEKPALLRCVAAALNKASPDTFLVSSDLDAVGEASALSLSSLRAEVAALIAQAASLEQLVASLPAEDRGRFLFSASWRQQMRGAAEAARRELAAAEAEWRDLLACFGENEDATPAALFGATAALLGQLGRAYEAALEQSSTVQTVAAEVGTESTAASASMPRSASSLSLNLAAVSAEAGAERLLEDMRSGRPATARRAARAARRLELQNAKK